MKRPLYVLDTSVAVAWYLEETFSPKAREWQQMLLDGHVVMCVPSLHYWEFANVMRTLVERRELDRKLAQDIYGLHLEAPLQRAEPDERSVLENALQYGATAYDAVFITLALSKEAPLITAERTTTEWVTRLKGRIESVR
jgi:predicted nucleic acid-binding protein